MHKDIDNIRHLINKYMDGETTTEEHRILARFFRETDNLPNDLLPYRDMFAMFDAGMPDFTDEELSSMLAENPDEAMLEEHATTGKRNTLKRTLKYASAIAACILAFIAGTVVRNGGNGEDATVSPGPQLMSERKDTAVKTITLTDTVRLRDTVFIEKKIHVPAKPVQDDILTAQEVKKERGNVIDNNGIDIYAEYERMSSSMDELADKYIGEIITTDSTTIFM